MSCRVAVIGGGPAGSVCSFHLARAGIDVFLFERNSQREKPCGGGLTLRAIKLIPNWRTLQIKYADIAQLRLMSPGGHCVDFELNTSICIVSRRHFDSALRRSAVSAGATLIEKTVRKLSPASKGGWIVNGRHVDIVVGAGGINDPLARFLDLSVPLGQRGQAMGYFVPGRFPQRIICRFFPGLRGYAWWFPRTDHASLGVEFFEKQSKLTQPRTLLDRFIRQDLDHLAEISPKIELNQAKPYAWSEPILTPEMFKTRPLNGRDWLLVGDAAGLIDTITGEGIPYALKSGQLAADAIVSGHLPNYSASLKNRIIPELIAAARMSPMFYYTPLLRWLFFVLSNSKTMQGVTKDITAGRQNYQHIKRRILYEAPRIVKDIGLNLVNRTQKKEL
jgi:geranylgeranyl reductase family protein